MDTCLTRNAFRTFAASGAPFTVCSISGRLKRMRWTSCFSTSMGTMWFSACWTFAVKPHEQRSAVFYVVSFLTSDDVSVSTSVSEMESTFQTWSCEWNGLSASKLASRRIVGAFPGYFAILCLLNFIKYEARCYWSYVEM